MINKFKDLGNNQKLLRKSIEKANINAKQGLSPLRRDKERTEAQLAKVNKELKHLIEFVKTQDLDKKRARGIVKEISDLEGAKETLEDEIHRIETNMQHLNQHVIDADTFARLFKEFPKVFETFSFDEKRNLILLLVKEVIYTPVSVKVLFWGDLPEMNLDLKNPPDWTPPPPDAGDTPYTPKGSGGSGVEAPMRTRKKVRMGVLNGSSGRTRLLQSQELLAQAPRAH